MIDSFSVPLLKMGRDYKWNGYPVGISDDGTQIVYIVSLGDYRILLLYNFIENKWTSVDAIKTDSANESVTFQNGKITWGLTERTNAGYLLNIYEYTLQTKEKKRIFHSNAYENYYDIRLVEYSDNTVVYYQGADKRRLVVYDIADKKIKYRMEIGFVPESRGILKIDEFCYYLLGAEDDIYFFNLKENVIYHTLINKHFEHHFMEHNGQLILIIDDKFYRLKL